MTDTTSLPLRSQVPVEQTWDLASVFPTPKDWEDACAQLASRLPDLSVYHGHLAENPLTLLQYVQAFQDAATLMGKISLYANNAYAVDSLDQEAAARNGQARSLMAKFGAATAFFDPELMQIGFPRLRQWIKEDVRLAFLAHYVDRLEKRQKHVRSGEVEQVLAMVNDPFFSASGIYNALNNAELTFEPAKAADGTLHEVGQASIGALVTHPDREIRRTAWENYSDGYLKLKSTMAATLTTTIKQDVFNARARGYANSLEASLAPNNIPVEVFHNLIEVFKKNLPTWHRYWQLRKKLLGYDKFHVYDIKAPLTMKKPLVPFKQAVDWIVEGMAPLGKEYVDILRYGVLEKRWVDYARNKGKREGAFSSGSMGTRPFIMMSYSDDVFSLSTLAHELGHSMHSNYSRLYQPFIYSRYALFVAEVASNFNQAMVRRHLFETQTAPEFQVSLIEEAMSNYHRYFFIMPTLARFELELHTRAEKGLPISADILIGLTADLFKEGYSDEVEFDRDRIGITWAQFGHMYMNFYVYQYATGISGAHALVDGILAGKPEAAQKYLEFLKLGGSMYPLDSLKMAGVDLTSPEPVERAFEVLSGLVDRLEKLQA
ncbi:MAG: oligoendopeptidase F [Anaerolineales bacterium]|nr:MAG: oligoendopeptidase F [Anaerolineales bacterium]